MTSKARSITLIEISGLPCPLRVTYNLKNGTIKWYTDGSVMENGTGLGVFGPRVKHSEALGRNTSIFQAEVAAILRCACLNLSRGYRNKEIAILSDSQAALKALSSTTTQSKLVEETIAELETLAQTNKVSLLWVPGHTRISGNEEADTLAKAGSCNTMIGPEPCFGLGRHTIRQHLREMENNHKLQHWETQDGMRQAKALIQGFNHKRFKAMISIGKNQIRILTGLLTGHCKLRNHLFNIGLSNTNLCRFCELDAETSEHILTKCDALARRRKLQLGEFHLNAPQIHHINPTAILCYVQSIGLAAEL